MAPEGSVSRTVLQLEGGPEDSQAGLATRMPARQGIAIARGILVAAFMVSLHSGAPGASMAGRDWLRPSILLEDQSACRVGWSYLWAGETTTGVVRMSSGVYIED